MPSYEKVSGNKKYPMVGVLDNGIANIEMMSSWVYRDEKQYCPERQHPTHGSFVAGVILYGDEFSDKNGLQGKKLRFMMQLLYQILVFTNWKKMSFCSD